MLTRYLIQLMDPGETWEAWSERRSTELHIDPPQVLHKSKTFEEPKMGLQELKIFYEKWR